MRDLIVKLSFVALFVGCTNQSPPIDSATRNTLTDTEPSANDAQGVGTPDNGSESGAATHETIGKPAPAFENLAGIDDQRHSLKDYSDAKAIVIAFICNHCPVAVAYEDRLISLQDDYADQGVQLIAINVNNLEEDKLPAMKDRAEEKGFTFPYLYDPSQKVGHDYGATVTPHIFLLDEQRRFAYVGPIDDNQDEAKVTEQFLRDAIDAVLAGNMPETTNVKPFGCGIKYE